jgi:hypothetical protein
MPHDPARLADAMRAYGCQGLGQTSIRRLAPAPRRVATRYEKTAVNFLGFVLFAALRVWLA